MRPRIRTLKPEVWQDERVGGLSRDARLLFVGLVTMADDEGRLRALPASILGHVFPYDLDAPRKLDAWTREVVATGIVASYTVDGIPYLAFRHWTRHQRINRPTASTLPPPPPGAITEESLSDHGARGEGSSLPCVRADRIGSGSEQEPPLSPQGEISYPSPPAGKRKRELAAFTTACEQIADRLFPGRDGFLREDSVQLVKNAISSGADSDERVREFIASWRPDLIGAAA